ncbi:hypothetical protein [Streptosporangium sp. V21-05]|uniref:hypothetical protein n=1 Tax=Streptosporangium sp. V21-05 TaxID=3446115 RepID=UPI003F52B8A3
MTSGPSPATNSILERWSKIVRPRPVHASMTAATWSSGSAGRVTVRASFPEDAVFGQSEDERFDQLTIT